MTEPTDAEIIALADETRPAEGGANGYILPISFARAVLAKWGAQPVPAGYALVPAEPTPAMLSVMWVNKNSSLSEAYNSLSEAYSAMLAASPQPVAREPLTCEWAHNEDDGFWDTECGQSWRFDDGGPKENHMNFCHCCGKPLRIKGGQHGAE